MPPQEQNTNPTPAQTPAPAAPETPQDPINPNAPLPTTSPVTPKKSNTMLWVVVAVVVLAVAGVVYWLMMGK
jgi:hypothetical protein